MPFGRRRHAGVSHAGHEPATVRRVPHRHVHALVGHDPAHDEGADTEVAQDVIEVGGIEDPRRGLGQEDLVVGRRELRDRIACGIEGSDMDRGELVIERPVSTVAREAADDRMDHLDTCSTSGLHEAARLRHRAGPGFPIEGMVCVAVGMVGVSSRLQPDALHVDDEKRRLAAAVGLVTGWALGGHGGVVRAEGIQPRG